MKITKSKLLRLIKEETEAALAEENGDPSVESGEGWINEMEDWMLTLWTNRPRNMGDLARTYGRERAEEEEEREEARIERLKEKTVEFYNKLPDIGKEHLIKNLEMYAEKFDWPWTEYLNALSAPLEEAVYHRDEEEPVDLNTMDPNEAFGFAWNQAIEILQGAGHSEAACLLSAAAGEDPDDERVGDQPPEEVELDMALNERKDVEIGDIVKHAEYGQGRLVALRSGKGGDRRAVVKWDKKGENRETIVDALTVVKKGKKK